MVLATTSFKTLFCKQETEDPPPTSPCTPGSNARPTHSILVALRVMGVILAFLVAIVLLVILSTYQSFRVHQAIGPIFGIFYRDFEWKYWWWSIACMIRMYLLSLIISYLYINDFNDRFSFSTIPITAWLALLFF
eukprot:TRINITY_DN868_c0_g1_i17.p1 TRINITY_DN868_c0_g1~~TRINITY_DN868_c0_g1_i17.p1  ORF type:complete len:135 (-),score=25.54 TRINITY_DN868_c0_g1_i17:451-855(-)